MVYPDWPGAVLAVLLVAATFWLLYLYGSFEMTGVRGWRRVWAGWRLVLDQVVIRLRRWVAQARRRRP